jgi:Domain of unknown function (DUF4190)
LSHPTQAPYESYGPPTHDHAAYGPPSFGPPTKKGAGLAIASMVLGIVALVFSWIPIINNVAAIVAVVGLGLGIPGLVLARRGTHRGQGPAITGLVTSVLAIAVVILTQILFVKAIDEARQGLDEAIVKSQTDLTEPVVEEDADPAADVVPLGTPAQIGDYQVTVDAVELNGDETVAAANQFNEPPSGRYVITQVTATYVGGDEGSPGWDLTAVFHGNDARQYSDSDCLATLPYGAMEAPTLNSGGTATFQFCMDVPPAAIDGGQLSVEPTVSFDSSDRVFFALS